MNKLNILKARVVIRPKIKTLYPSCSELVTHLDFSDMEDVRRTLRTITDITGCEVGYVTTEFLPSTTPLWAGHQEKTVQRFFKVDINDIIVVKDKIGVPKETLANYKVNPIYDSDGIVPVRLFDRRSRVSLCITMSSSCGESGLSIMSSQQTGEFAVLAKIIEYFSSRFHGCGGGGALDFLKWCRRNNKAELSKYES